MAKPMKFEMFGLPCIARHDYDIPGLKEKLQEYQKKSADAFTHFMTNVPTLAYGSFLDVGPGDPYVMNLMKPLFNEVRGIDNFIDEDEYPEIDTGDWDTMADGVYSGKKFDAIFINHSLEHAANVYKLMEQVKKIQRPGGALFVAVPDGDTEFGYGITSSTTHFSCITEGYLSTTLQRFGYQVQISRREFRPGAKEIWAFAIKH
jgi:2-polyprenyl-3-methyl-5-hydroxy-6-metoxy-1,4-benzoquinol methylase